jgi:hypothetical protein
MQMRGRLSPGTDTPDIHQCQQSMLLGTSPMLHIFPQFAMSPLLSLPAELRNLILEHVLGQDFIRIECAVASVRPHATRVLDHSFGKEILKKYPLRVPRVNRRLWSVPAFDLEYTTDNRAATRTGLPSARGEAVAVHMTYQLARRASDTPQDRPGLHILRVSKQMYKEASEIFWGCNIFSFTSDFRIATAFAFLCDRPAASLRLIKALEIALAESNNMKGTQQAHYPVIRRSTDSEVLRYAYNHFTDLCTLLSTPRMKLQRLYLVVETLTGCSARNQDSLEEGITYERDAFRSARFEPPSWLAPLLQIQGLQSVDLCWWMYSKLRIQRMACTAGLIKQNMLTKGRTRVTLRETSEGEYEQGPFDFRVYRNLKEPCDVSAKRQWVWDRVTLEGDDVRYLAQGSSDTDYAMVFAGDVPETMGRSCYGQMWICLCTLS